MVLSCTIDSIPKGILSNQAVRFFPTFSYGATPALAGATAFLWQFGDGATSYDWTPVHVYPTVVSASPYSVSLTIKDSSFTTYSTTVSWAVLQEDEGNIDDVPNDGTFSTVSLLIYDESSSIMVNRNAWSSCSLYLLTPKVVQSIDKIGTLTFSILDVGNSTATERSLIVEGKSVVLFQGKSIVFSGVIRRATQNTQNGFLGVTRVSLWDFECDSDLAKLKKLNIVSDTTAPSRLVIDSPGNIARIVLTPDSGERDSRGVMNCVDSNIVYTLNYTSSAESAGDRYSNLMTLQSLTNYDLRVRTDYLIYEFTSFDTATAFTFSGVSWDTDEFSDGYIAVVGDSPTGISTFGKISANNSDTVFSASLVGAASSPTTGFAIIYRGYLVDFANDLSQPSPVQWYDINSTVYGFTDNDDKRKLNTKVIVSGKDINGESISVSLSGVHAYDDNQQFFNDSTKITTPSEGYVAKHTFAPNAVSSTVVLPSNADFYYEAADSTVLVPSGGASGFPVGATVDFVGVNLPTGLTAGTVYYVVEGNSAYIRVSASANGTVISCSGGAGAGNITGKSYMRESVFSYSGLNSFSEDDYVSITATTVPTGLTEGAAYWIDDHRYIGTRGSTSWDRGAFRLSYLGPGTAHAIPTSTGAGVYTYKVSGIANSPSGGVTVAVWLYGWGYTIPSGLTCSLVIPNSSTYINFVTSGTNVEEVLPDGSLVTRVGAGVGKMIVGSTDYGNRGYFMSPRLFVADNTKVGTNQVLVGEELLTITAVGTHATYGNYIDIGTASSRISSSSKKCYPHGVGALVARTNYTEAAPESMSVVSEYGLRINAVSVETNTTYGKLDTYATNLLLGFGAFYKIANCYTTILNSYCKRVGSWYKGQQCDLPTPLFVGDRLSFTEYSGATPVTYQVVSITTDYDGGIVSFELGDFENNVFTSLEKKTNAVNRTMS